ncbi:MAG TPA: hypothetical protein VGI11_04440 [Variovorax sp.]
MYYMNTDRDNFHDWARDKPDTTSFSGLHRLEARQFERVPGVRWGRLGFLALIVVALVAVAKHFIGS